MDATTAKLKEELKRAGLTDHAIEAAWPAWWSDEAASSPSARAELRFTLARRLGLAPKPLLGERVEFVWHDNARFKRLAGLDEVAKDAVTSFGIAIGQHLLRATTPMVDLTGVSAEQLRSLLIQGNHQVDLLGLLALCWSVGIPVVHLRVFPLQAKSMHAMVVKADNRFAILLGKDAQYPAPIAFTLAHEIGHVLLGHLGSEAVLVDAEDPAEGEEGDDDETSADRFALEVLTGSPEPDIRHNVDRFNASQLADAVLRAGPEYRIEPGTLALCLAYRTKTWPVAMAALRQIYSVEKPAWREVNGFAATQLAWDNLGDDSADYLRNIMGIGDA